MTTARVKPSESPAMRTGGLAIVVVMIGVMITAVDTTIVVLALPVIERSLHVALASVIWVVIGYLLVITLLATQVGRLGDMFGRVRIASRSISRHLAFAIFVGSEDLHGSLSEAFTSGLHAAFYASMGLMAVAAAFSATRALARQAPSRSKRRGS